MKSKNPYTFFQKFCLRTPLLSLDFYHDLTGEKNITPEKYKAIWDNAVIREAVFLASPELFEALEKWFDGSLTDTGKIQRLQHTFLKYLSRMSSRCTPFGLFAGCSTGIFGQTTRIELKPYTENSRQTRFDMNFLVALSQKLSGEARIRKQLLWYPNTSLYKIGKQYRYVEYTYNQHNKREHSIEALTHTSYLEAVLTGAASGKRIAELVPLLVTDDITPGEAEAFIEELIENQVLVSELEPSVTGDDFLVQLRQGLEKLQDTGDMVGEITQFLQYMEVTDSRLGNAPQRYIGLNSSLEKLNTPFELKYLFQTDMYPQTEAHTLHIRWAYRMKRAMPFLNKISPAPQNNRLQQFKNAFIKRYETREVPLASALDTEIGTGYLQDREAVDSTPFLDDLEMPLRYKASQELFWNPVQEMLYRKLRETLQNKAYILHLNDEDADTLEENWNDLPDTLSAMVEIVEINGEEKMVWSHLGGSSAANLLGRFSTGTPEIRAHVAQIVALEKQMHPGTLMAEIVHLPESRTGNVIRRASLREYEIPYLGRSCLPPEKQLPLGDLMLSVRQNRLVLRSRKHDKEVLPRLTNAHNYSLNALPVYHFLCDMQRQDMRPGMGFHWGGVQEKHSFLPRVVYKDFILSKARWKITKEDIGFLMDKKKKSGNLMDEVSSWRDKMQLPELVQLVEADNTLLIHLGHPDSVAMWLHTVRNRPYFILEEFLFTGESIVKQGAQRYTNQLVISFYNEAKAGKE